VWDYSSDLIDWIEGNAMSYFDFPWMVPQRTPKANATACTSQASAFVSANGFNADVISALTGISSTNILGLSALESNWGTSNVAVNYGNYFGLTVGRAFAGTIGSYTTTDGRLFGVYAFGFLDSGLSFANSFQGAKVVGISDPTAFAQALTAPPLAFNSEKGYAGKLVTRIGQVAACR
jgi:hypothetical protein